MCIVSNRKFAYCNIGSAMYPEYLNGGRDSLTILGCQAGLLLF